MINTTLCYIEQNGKYLMLLRNKKKHDVNAGKWIGVGGKFEAGETAEQCAMREIKEETGLTALRLMPRGVVYFHSEGWESEVMYLFTVPEWEGTLTECDEGELRWVDKREVFGLNLWDGDRIFLEYLMKDVPYFEMTLRYRDDRLYQAVADGKELELFDIFHEDGTPAGYVAERGYAHCHALWHATARIWVVRPKAGGDGVELLLQLRSAKKKLHPAKYDASSAGHIAAGEDILTGAVRELEEELGISVSGDSLEPVAVVTSVIDFDTPDGQPYHDREHCHLFLCRVDVKDSDIYTQVSEVDGVKWISPDECLRAVQTGAFPNCIDPQELSLVLSKL